MMAPDAAGEVSAVLQGLLSFVGCSRRSLNRIDGNEEHLWFVGEGRGRYEKVEKLVWVGHGNGSIDIEDGPRGQKNPKESGCGNFRCDKGLILIGLVLFLLTVGTVCLGISLFGSLFHVGTAEAHAATAAARRPSGAGAPSQFPIRARAYDGPDQASSGATDSGGGERRGGGEGKVPAASSSSGCSGSTEAWSDPRKMWCCHKRGVGCPERMCQAVYFEGGVEWSEKRRHWCCSHFGHGCPEGPSSSPAPSRRALSPAADRGAMQEMEVLERMDMDRAAQLPAGQGEGGGEALTADGHLARGAGSSEAFTADGHLP